MGWWILINPVSTPIVFHNWYLAVVQLRLALPASAGTWVSVNLYLALPQQIVLTHGNGTKNWNASRPLHTIAVNKFVTIWPFFQQRFHASLVLGFVSGYRVLTEIFIPVTSLLTCTVFIYTYHYCIFVVVYNTTGTGQLPVSQVNRQTACRLQA